MNIRIATPEDAFAIQNIYRYYVDNTAITCSFGEGVSGTNHEDIGEVSLPCC